MSQEFYTTKQLANILNLSVSTVAGWRRSGVGPKYYKIGYMTCVYKKKDIEDYLSKNEYNNTSQY